MYKNRIDTREKYKNISNIFGGQWSTKDSLTNVNKN